MNRFLRRSILLSLGGALFLLQSCALGIQTDTVEMTREMNNASANSVVLVIEDPRPLNRRQAKGSPIYASRLAYDADPLLTRSAQRLADETSSEFVFHWPIRSQNLLCVVVNTNKPDELIKNASLNQRILIAQRFNVFESLGDDSGTQRNKVMRENAVLTSGSSVPAAPARILVVDTGADKDHEDLLGANITEQDFVGAQLGFNVEIHGTNVVGIIAAQASNGIGIEGVAPESDITIARSCWQIASGAGKAQCNTLTLTAALDYALRDQFDVINLSLSGPRDPLLEMLVDKLIVQGAVIVAAHDPVRAKDARFPLWRPAGGVLFAKGDSSNSSDQPALNDWEIRAPYSAVTLQPGNEYDVVSGHSIASPYVAGQMANMLELVSELPSRELLYQLRSVSFPTQPVLENYHKR